jgi:hypothetical protein
MKLIFLIFVSALMLSASDPQAAKKTTAPAKAVKPLEIPKDAVETEPGAFHYTDSDGKKWVYRKTPFGVSRTEDKPVDGPAASAAAPAGAGIKAVEDGDIVHFERPGPFGPYKWQKKKSELDDNERAALDRVRTAAKAKQD